MSQAYVLPWTLVCATCGFGMQSHGVFTGGGLVVSCTGRACPEFEIRRRFQTRAIDLAELVDGDLIPIDEQPEKPASVEPPRADPAPTAPEAAVA